MSGYLNRANIVSIRDSGITSSTYSVEPRLPSMQTRRTRLPLKDRAMQKMKKPQYCIMCWLRPHPLEWFWSAFCTCERPFLACKRHVEEWRQTLLGMNGCMSSHFGFRNTQLFSVFRTALGVKSARMLFLFRGSH